jgi:nitroimidazol reductase NimA-like FMN-containing flavoprotein (pyridoxamine 5'-phosphate oxidase superfamily)
MPGHDPEAELQAQFSSPDASPTPWPEARQHLEQAEVYWVSTVRPDGRPHLTPIIAVWLDDTLYFCTGPDERKAQNLEHNRHCLITTGSNALRAGLDIVVEGDAVNVRDEATLRRVAHVYESKYGSEWHFDVRDGAFQNEEAGRALVFAVPPAKAFGYGRGETYSATRWRF